MSETENLTLIPQLAFKQTGARHFYATDVLPLPSKSPFGNLTLKHVKIHARLRWINSKLKAAYRSFEAIRKAGPAFGLELYDHQFIVEEALYWLRKSADEMIGLAYVMEVFRQSGDFPKKINYDRIGAFEDHKHDDPAFVALFTPHLAELKTINQISNAYKHSFLDTDFNLLSRDELQVMAWASNNRGLDKGKFYCVPLREVVAGFSRFYTTCLDILEQAITAPGLKAIH